MRVVGPSGSVMAKNYVQDQQQYTWPGYRHYFLENDGINLDSFSQEEQSGNLFLLKAYLFQLAALKMRQILWGWSCILPARTEEIQIAAAAWYCHHGGVTTTPRRSIRRCLNKPISLCCWRYWPDPHNMRRFQGILWQLSLTNQFADPESWLNLSPLSQPVIMCNDRIVGTTGWQ